MRTIAIRGISIWALCVLAAAACTGSSPERSAEPPVRDTTPARVPRADTTGALPPPVAGDAQWSYRLTGGWLKSDDPSNHAPDEVPETTAECRGRAVVRRRPNGKACWSWTLNDVQCTGNGKPRDADWLHESSDSSYACRGDTAWETKADELPGRGFCIPHGTFNDKGELVNLRLECDWQCRVPGHGCYGGARYEFTRDTSSATTGSGRS